VDRASLADRLDSFRNRNAWFGYLRRALVPVTRATGANTRSGSSTRLTPPNASRGRRWTPRGRRRDHQPQQPPTKTASEQARQPKPSDGLEPSTASLPWGHGGLQALAGVWQCRCKLASLGSGQGCGFGPPVCGGGCPTDVPLWGRRSEVRFRLAAMNSSPPARTPPVRSDNPARQAPPEH
jgi:hypothetical protein